MFKKRSKPTSLRGWKRPTDNDNNNDGVNETTTVVVKNDPSDAVRDVVESVKDNDGPMNNDKYDDDDDDTSAIQQAIRRTQKKQRILSSLPLTSSSGITGYGGSSRSSKSTMGSTGIGDNKNNMSRETIITGELSILANKHKKNMEEFIEQHIAAKMTATTDGPNGRGASIDDDRNVVVTKGGVDIVQDEQDLYQQLARETYTGSQTTTSDGTTSQSRVDDEDKGAVLVGSGIAEVILPVHERLASLDRPGRKTLGASVRNKHIPSSSSAVPEGERNLLPSTTPTPVGRNMVTSLQRQQQQQQQQQQQRLINEGGKSSHPSGFDDEQGSHIRRRGFAEFLGKATATSSTASDPSSSSSSSQHGHQNQNQSSRGPNSSTSFHRGQQHNRDDQVFSKFVTRHFQENRR